LHGSASLWLVLALPWKVDARIDDPNAAWKGRALWTTTGDSNLLHDEVGKALMPDQRIAQRAYG
jgi:hypothetical protein